MSTLAIPGSTTGTAAILGGGVIGGGWAARFLLAGWNVQVFDPDPEAERKIAEVLTNARRSLPGLYETDLPAEGTLSFCDTLELAVGNADWIQESVPERLEIKHSVLKQVQAACSHEAIIASSTSGFKPSELQQDMTRPEQIIVAHPFNPVYLLPLVELVGNEGFATRAADILRPLGIHPVYVRKEIDAHIADRFLEAVWREGLWLIKDGYATTEEIDDIIRYGFGLRWAQMGLFETYRVAGGEAGMAHFIAQFGPALKWPWTKLMDVPELTDELINTIADQSDAQSGQYSIRELERARDDNLVGILRSLKQRDWGAGALLNKFDQALTPPAKPPAECDLSKPIRSVSRSVPIDWTDYNGHMNESRYGQVFSDAADRVMVLVGADQKYISEGLSYFTVENNIRYIDETQAGEKIYVDTLVVIGEGKKLRLVHEMRNAEDDRLLSTGVQMLIHVSLETRRACEPRADVLEKKRAYAAAHAKLPKPDFLGDN